MFNAHKDKLELVKTGRIFSPVFLGYIQFPCIEANTTVKSTFYGVIQAVKRGFFFFCERNKKKRIGYLLNRRYADETRKAGETLKREK